MSLGDIDLTGLVEADHSRTPFIEGDPYGQPEETVRSVTFADADALYPGKDFGIGGIGGHPPLWSLSTASGCGYDEDSGSAAGLSYPPPPPVFLEKSAKNYQDFGLRELSAQGYGFQEFESLHQTFQESHGRGLQPTAILEPKRMDSKFVKATHVELHGMHPTDALVRTCNIISGEVGGVRAAIVKDGTMDGRASFKAQAFVDIDNCGMLECTMRAKVFLTDHGAHVLELMRCSGDSVAFGHLFATVAARLVGDKDSAIAAPPALPQEVPVPEDSGVEPLVQMLSAECPEAQAQAARQLASLAKTATGRSKLFAVIKDVHEVLAVLLASTHLAACYPVALVVAELLRAPSGEVERFGGTDAAAACGCLRQAAARARVEGAALVQGALQLA